MQNERDTRLYDETTAQLVVYNNTRFADLETINAVQREKVDDGSDHAFKGYDNHGSAIYKNESSGNRLRFISC